MLRGIDNFLDALFDDYFYLEDLDHSTQVIKFVRKLLSKTFVKQN